MKKNIVICDACGAESNPSTRIDVWKSINLNIPMGTCRLSKDFDLCPMCQDVVLNAIEDIHQKYENGKLIV